MSLDDATRARLRRCFPCGVCNLALDVEDGWNHSIVGPPSRWVVAVTEADARGEAWVDLARVLRSVRESTVVQMERTCPVGVPFAALRRAARAATPWAPPPSKRVREDPG